MADAPLPPIKLNTPEAPRPERLDKWLSHQLPDISRSKLQQWIQDGRIRINQHPVSANMPLPGGETVVIHPVRDPEREALTPENSEISVLYKDADLIFIDKPARLVVHPAPGNPKGTLVNRMIHHYPDLTTVGDPYRPGLVHRLDADTSGVMVFARTPAALEALQHQFQERETHKIYTALVPGIPNPVRQTIDAPIGRHPSNRIKRAVNGSGARHAVTHFSMVKGLAAGKLSVLSVTIETGRTHQIRVHLEHIGMPVLGDPIYGGRKGQLPASLPEPPRLMLHAASLEVTHPTSGNRIKIEAPLAPDIQSYINQVNSL